MASKPQIPTAPEVIGPAIDKFVLVKPNAIPFLDNGNWSFLITGLEGQAILALDRLSKEAVATRLPLASGQPLTELARSEYDTLRLTTSTNSIGEIVLTRRVVHYDQTVPFITAVDAITETSVYSLGNAITSSFNTHIASVFNANLGYGSHISQDIPITPFITSSSTMSEVVNAVNNLKTEILVHFANETVHTQSDIKSLISVSNAVASAPASAFSANSPASQQSVYRVINAIKSAVNTHYGIVAKAGVIKVGSKWSIQADLNASPPIYGAQFNSIRDVVVSIGQASVVIDIESSITGTNGNTPSWIMGGQILSISKQTTLFDDAETEKFITVSLKAAGGIDQETDAVLRMSSKAKFRGRNGPTNSAILAGSLEDGRIAHATTLDELETTGISYVYVADYSWAQSDALLNEIKQNLKNNWEGAGCKVTMGSIQNKLIRLDATISLRDASFLSDTSDILTDVQDALTSYFDDRSDYYLWTLNTLKSVVSRCNRKILSCPLIIVRDEDGIVLNEPTAPTAGDVLIHYWLLDNAINISFTSPI